MSDTPNEKDTNPDPITGAPGSHPVGTGLGAAGAGTAGAAVGMAVGGPVGAVVGAVVGSVAGGYAGKGVAEAIDPTAEDAHWRDAHRNESYFEKDYSYEDYAPAYRTGYSSFAEHRAAGRSFDAAEPDLATRYNRDRGSSRLGWDKAKHATRAAWDRVERAIPGDSDRDGK
ncbi:MAG TPA: hypothetical protein VF593_00280 [Chthoniobacteraceae bacterium]|jgi:uncharacterized protein YcfJ